MPLRSPYETLGVRPGATDAEVRAAYRRLVQRHHPDHNRNSPESTRRFEEIQDAYAQVLRERKNGPAPHAPPAADPDLDARLSDLERQVRATQERVRRAARKATATKAKRPSDEELGYFSTDDSFTSILADARQEFGKRLDAERERHQDHPVVRRVSDLIDGLEELASKLDRKPPK